MSAERRLPRFRAALAVFVVMTILLVVLALPTIERIAHRQTMAVGWMPAQGAPIVAVGILLALWASFVGPPKKDACTPTVAEPPESASGDEQRGANRSTETPRHP
jgi:hypothetical protein